MSTNVLMPQMGYDMREGTVVSWKKAEGDQVSRGELIAEIETDKAVVEMESIVAGILRRIVVSEGQLVSVGTVIAIIGTADEAIPDVDESGATEPEKVKEEKPQPSKDTKAKTTTDKPSGGPVKASPVAKRLAKEHGIDLALVVGSGPGGRIVEKDVLSHAQDTSVEASAVEESGERVDLTRMRQTIASRTADSKREAPHFYVTVEIDMSKAMALRKQINEDMKGTAKVSINDMLIKATSMALGKFPNFNATFKGDHLEVHQDINMGIAIALSEGLIVPAVPHCENKSLVEISKASKDLIDRANEGKLTAEEYTGGTFSISNLGMFDVESFAAIIFPPNAAVIAVGSITEQPVVRDGEITISHILKATISSDHRIADGADAAKFIGAVKRNMEKPMVLIA